MSSEKDKEIEKDKSKEKKSDELEIELISSKLDDVTPLNVEKIEEKEFPPFLFHALSGVLEPYQSEKTRGFESILEEEKDYSEKIEVKEKIETLYVNVSPRSKDRKKIDPIVIHVKTKKDVGEEYTDIEMTDVKKPEKEIPEEEDKKELDEKKVQLDKIEGKYKKTKQLLRKKKLKKIFVCCLIFGTSLFVIGVIVAFILIFLSLESISYKNYGVLYNEISREVESDQVFGPAETVDFSLDQAFTPDLKELDCRTIDGVIINIECSFQYYLEQDRLFGLFKKFGIGYKEFLYEISRSVIQDSISQWEALDFFINRIGIAHRIQNLLNDTFREIGVKLFGFQLRKVSISEEFEQSILEKELSREKISKSNIEKELNVLLSEIDVRVSEIEKNKTLIIEAANAKAIEIEAFGEAESLKIKKEALSSYYKAIKTDLGFNSSELEQFKYIQDVNYNGKLVESIINMNKPLIIKGN